MTDNPLTEFLFGPARLYGEDKKFLLDELPDFTVSRKIDDLETLELPHFEEIYIGQLLGWECNGEHKKLRHSIELSVTACPAQFWSAKVRNYGDGKARKITFGSGTLKQYWPTIKMLADGMFDVKPI